jgi:hypothetical protein
MQQSPEINPPRETGSRPEYIEIQTGAKRRIWGWVGFLLLFLAIAGLLVVIFIQFTASVALAVALVLFMIAYMAIMGWLASRKIERRE